MDFENGQRVIKQRRNIHNYDSRSSKVFEKITKRLHPCSFVSYIFLYPYVCNKQMQHNKIRYRSAQTYEWSSQHPHTAASPTLPSSSLFHRRTLGAYTSLTPADYYSVAIKSQFGAGRLSGHLKGHGTRRVVGAIEMDGVVKVEPASLGWKCGCKTLEMQQI